MLLYFLMSLSPWLAVGGRRLPRPMDVSSSTGTRAGRPGRRSSRRDGELKIYFLGVGFGGDRWECCLLIARHVLGKAPIACPQQAYDIPSLSRAPSARMEATPKDRRTTSIPHHGMTIGDALAAAEVPMTRGSIRTNTHHMRGSCSVGPSMFARRHLLVTTRGVGEDV
jgi:hypothetical protein